MTPNELALGLANFQDTLRRRLEACGITCRRLSEEEIWNRVRDRYLSRFAKMTKTFVGRCRQTGFSPSSLGDRIAGHQPLSEVEATFLRLAVDVFATYLTRLSAIGEEDFAGLLERAAIAVEEGKADFERKSGRGDLSKIRFVMVDEFQDFSPLFFRILQAARRHNPTMQVFCVEDDWQTINVFAGYNLRYFECFDDHFAPALRLSIVTNYRSAACAVGIGNLLMSGRGIQARSGKDHTGRVLIADLSQFEPSVVEREMYPGVVITPVVRRLLLNALDGDGRAALLARRNCMPYYLGNDVGRSTLEKYHRVWTKGLSDEQVERVSISTAHKYKGLQAETVVILDAVERSYPLIHPDWVFMRVFGDSVEKLIEDERSLFYVACTRAINTLITVTERDGEAASPQGLKDKCVPLDWRNFPPVDCTSGWIVKVGSCPRRGSKPTYDVRADLCAYGFRFFSVSEWPHWARTYPPSDGDIQSVVNSLGEEAWAKKGGLEIRICDRNESVFGVYRADGGPSRLSIWAELRVQHRCSFIFPHGPRRMSPSKFSSLISLSTLLLGFRGPAESCVSYSGGLGTPRSCDGFPPPRRIGAGRLQTEREPPDSG